MTEFMRAHGYVPGPTQRPVLTGLLTGAAAGLAALPLLWRSGALPALSGALRIEAWAAAAVCAAAFTLAGVLYGRLFMRGANDRRGGWLFGISYGFLLWAVGPVTLLGWVLRRPVATGAAAIGLFAGHLLFGLLLGVSFPWVHRWLTRRRLFAE